MMRFTIITCTYNAADVLQPTLDSIATQQYPAVEHLIIDGGSADATVSIAQRYKQQTEAEEPQGRTVVVTSEPDKGLYDAMNKGLAKATGDYLVFLNAGDTLPDADTLADIARTVGNERPGVLYGDTDIVDREGHFLRHRRLAPPEHLTWHSFRHGMLVCHQAFYVRTDIAKQVSYNLRYHYSADVDWCIRVMKQCQQSGLTLKNLHRRVACYLDGGMSATNHRASLHERFTIMRSHYGLITTLTMHLWFMVRAILKR